MYMYVCGVYACICVTLCVCACVEARGMLHSYCLVPLKQGLSLNMKPGRQPAILTILLLLQARMWLCSAFSWELIPNSGHHACVAGFLTL